MKFVLWIREDRNGDNPVYVNLYDGEINFNKNVVNIKEGEFLHSFNLKDVSMIDFNVKEYQFLEKG